MRIAKIPPLLTILLGFMVACLSLLVRPLWFDINEFLGTQLPVMPMILIFGVVSAGYGIHLTRGGFIDSPKAWRHHAILIIIDIFMLGLLYLFFSELDSEQVMITRNLSNALPFILWFGLAGWMLWSPPRSKTGRGFVLIILILSAVLWKSMPLTIRFISRPATYFQQDGINIIWRSNIRAMSWVEYGSDENMNSSIQEQSDGLKVTGEEIQRVFLPTTNWNGDLYFKAHMEGVRNIFPIHADKTGIVDGDLLKINLPEDGEKLSFVAFSDIHERSSNLKKMANQVEWENQDLVIQLGDLVNHVADAQQVEDSILTFPTGGVDLPRVFVRGNHETRGESARLMDDWFLPQGGNYYFSFKTGDVFFIVLDSGEDKPDDHVEYSGLVDFTSYNLQQADWLERVLGSPEYKDAKYHLVLVHRPPNTTIAPHFAPVMSQLINRDDIHLVLSGDSHVAGIFSPGETGLPFTVANCGGSELDDMAVVLVKVHPDTIDLSVIRIDGVVLESSTIPK